MPKKKIQELTVRLDIYGFLVKSPSNLLQRVALCSSCAAKRSLNSVIHKLEQDNETVMMDKCSDCGAVRPHIVRDLFGLEYNALLDAVVLGENPLVKPNYFRLHLILPSHHVQAHKKGLK